MARTRAAAGRGRGEAPEVGQGRGRGAAPVAARGRGRGGGRGRGRGNAPEVPVQAEQPNLQNPELIAMITQVVNAVMNQRGVGTGDEQEVNRGGQREVGTGNVDAGVNQDVVNVGDDAGGYFEDVEQGIRVGNVPRGRRTGVK